MMTDKGLHYLADRILMSAVAIAIALVLTAF